MCAIKDRIVMWQFSSKGIGADFGAESQYIDLNHLYGEFVQVSNQTQETKTEPVQNNQETPTQVYNNIYMVRKGDTLSKIAMAYGLSLQDLINANPQISNINLILVGQKINIPILTTVITPQSKLKVGDRVRVTNGARTYAGGKIASFVFEKSYFIDELKGDRAVLNKKGICTPINIKDLIKVG